MSLIAIIIVKQDRLYYNVLVGVFETQKIIVSFISAILGIKILFEI